MKVGPPQFCESCGQYEKADGEKYCRRCFAIKEGEARTYLIGRFGFLIIVVIVGSIAVGLVSFCSSRKTTSLEHNGNVNQSPVR